jgi:hypothetical protein
VEEADLMQTSIHEVPILHPCDACGAHEQRYAWDADNVCVYCYEFLVADRAARQSGATTMVDIFSAREDILRTMTGEHRD